MKHRRKHAAVWRPPRISQREIHFHDVFGALENVSVVGHVKTAQHVGEAIHLWRHARRTRDADQRPVGKTLREQFVIELKTPDARRNHGNQTTYKLRITPNDNSTTTPA